MESFLQPSLTKNQTGTTTKIPWFLCQFIVARPPHVWCTTVLFVVRYVSKIMPTCAIIYCSSTYCQSTINATTIPQEMCSHVCCTIIVILPTVRFWLSWEMCFSSPWDLCHSREFFLSLFINGVINLSFLSCFIL